jgi:hypothetical protein
VAWVAAQQREAVGDPFEVRRQARASRRAIRLAAADHRRGDRIRGRSGGIGHGGGRQAERTAPIIEDVEHVAITEAHVQWPATGPLAVVALEGAIDARERHLERYSLLGPASHEVEGRTGDANQVPIVLAAQMRLHGAAVAVEIDALVDRRVRIAHSHVTSPARMARVSPPGVRTSNAPVRSTPDVVPAT